MSTLRTIAALFAPMLKRKWFSRGDIVFLSFIAILGIALLFLPRIPASSLVGGGSGLGQGGTSQTPSRNGPGPGGGGGSPGGIDNSQITSTSNNLVNSAQQASTSTPDWAGGILLHTKPDYTSTNTYIRGAWWGMVAVVDVFVVFIVILNGYRVMAGAAGFRYAETIETFPRIILAIVAAHLSIIFVSFWIGLNNQLCYYIIAWVNPSAGFQQAQFSALFQAFFHSLLSMINPFADIGGLVGTLLSTIVGIAALILFFLLLVQAIVRIALINLLTILAPLGFACWALPQGAGQQVTRLWLNALIASIMAQLLQVICLSLGFILYNNLQGLAILGISGILVGQIATYWLALKVPSWLQNSVVQTMGSASQSVMSTINQVAMTIQQALSSAVLVATR